MSSAMASLNMAAVVPVAVSRSNDTISANVGSSANFGGMRLCSVSTAAPNVSRSSRSLVVRAEQKSLWETITSLFGRGEKKVTEAAAQAEKELNKVASEAKSSSGGLGDKAESLKEEGRTQAEVAAEEVKGGIEDLQSKVEEAVEAAKKN